MRIFIAWGYRERNRWIRELVYPVVKAFGDEVLHGEDIVNDTISAGVRQRLNNADAVIGFVTRRGDPGDDPRTTHLWVTQELAAALHVGKQVLEVREAGVDDQRGMLGGHQAVFFSEDKKAECIVEIVKALGAWHETNNVTLQLLPDECAEQIKPLLRDPNFRCSYTILDRGIESPELRATIRPIKGGLFVEARNVPRQALIQLKVEVGGRTWSSDFESTDSLGVRLRQD